MCGASQDWLQAIIRCPLSFVTLPIKDPTKMSKAISRRKIGNRKGKGKGKGKKCKTQHKTKKQSSEPSPIVYRRWPVMSPLAMLTAIRDAGAAHLLTLVSEFLCCFFSSAHCYKCERNTTSKLILAFLPPFTPRKGTVDWIDFWERMKGEPWGACLDSFN